MLANGISAHRTSQTLLALNESIPIVTTSSKQEASLGSDRIDSGFAINAYGVLANGDFNTAYHVQQTANPRSTDAASGSQPDPWGVAGSAFFAAIGALLVGATGGIGGGAGGTLAAPGVGTVGGGIAAGAEGAALGGAAGATIGDGVGSAAHELMTWMTGSSSTTGSPGAGDPQKPDRATVKAYHDNPHQFEGRPASEVETELDEKLVKAAHWAKKPLVDGNGVRYLDGKGGAISINRGYPGGMPKGLSGDLVHKGPYIKIMPENVRVPLAGNPAISGG